MPVKKIFNLDVKYYEGRYSLDNFLRNMQPTLSLRICATLLRRICWTRQQELVLKKPAACSLVRRTVEKASPFPIEFPPPRICENHGRFNLPFLHGPVPSEKTVLLLGANDLKAMPFVEADRPYRTRPGSDQYRTWRQLPQMRQQARSNSSLLADGGDVGVPDQSHVLDRLKAHHTCQLSAPVHVLPTHWCAAFAVSGYSPSLSKRLFRTRQTQALGGFGRLDPKEPETRDSISK
jgi:hypothetical protein